MDLDSTGTINLDNFVSALADPDDPEERVNLASANRPTSVPVPVHVEGMDGAAAEYSPPVLALEMLAGIVCRVAAVKSFSQVWTSYGTMAQMQGSSWHGSSNPLGDGAGIAFRNKLRINMGQYATEGFEEPSLACTTFEMIDTTKNKLQSSDRLEPVAACLLPYPVRYHAVWSQLQVAYCSSI